VAVLVITLHPVPGHPPGRWWSVPGGDFSQTPKIVLCSGIHVFNVVCSVDKPRQWKRHTWLNQWLLHFLSCRVL